jgi:hypothetical protein
LLEHEDELDVHDPAKDGDTMRKIARFAGDEVILYLLEKGTEVTIRDALRRRPFELINEIYKLGVEFGQSSRNDNGNVGTDIEGPPSVVVVRLRARRGDMLDRLFSDKHNGRWNVEMYVAA